MKLIFKDINFKNDHQDPLLRSSDQCRGERAANNHSHAIWLFDDFVFPSFFVIVSARLLMGISIALILPTLSSIALGLFGRKKFPSRVAKNEIWNPLLAIFGIFFFALLMPETKQKR